MARRRGKLTGDLFETRSHTWHSLGIGEELAPPGYSRRSLVGLVLALLLLAATLFVYYERSEIAPGYGQWIKIGTVVVLVVVGGAAIHWLHRALGPRLYRRLDPATAGTAGFVVRLLAVVAVVIFALRIAGVQPSTLAVGGAFTAVLLGLAAQQALAGVFAGIVLQGTRPFRVGERVRLVGGLLGGPQEGTVSSLGLFYTSLNQGAERLLVPNSLLLSVVVVPLREPERVDVRARFPADTSPRVVERRLLRSVTIPTRYPPTIALEEVDPESVVLRVEATPLNHGDASQLVEEVLEGLRDTEAETGELRVEETDRR